MKVKKEYLILLLIIAALSVYLFIRKEDRTLYELPVLPGISKKDISKIEITKGKTSIVLNKKDDQWYIGSRQYPADKNKIDDILDACEQLTLTALVSESKNYIRYDLTDEKKISVKAWQADTLIRHFDVGKAASSFRHTFVKLAEEDRVFHARSNFRNKFDQTVDNLREKTVLSFQAADITEIHITKDKASLTLTRTKVPQEETAKNEDKTEDSTTQPEKFVWQRADGEMGDALALNRLLSNLSNLRCDKFIDDRKKEDFNLPLYTVQLKGVQEYSLSIFAKLKEDDPNYPATSSASEYPFYLAKSRVEQIMKNPEDLLKKPGPDEKKPEPQKTKSNNTN